jgi:hypothetical protein
MPQRARSGGRYGFSWFDAEAGQTLSIEMWGTEEFLDDLLRQGFVERELEPLESDSLAVRAHPAGTARRALNAALSG